MKKNIKEHQNEKRRKTGAWIFAGIFHALLLLLFFLVSWTEPDPLPIEKVIEIEFDEGTTGSSGGSSSQSAARPQEETPLTPSEKVNTQNESPVFTPNNNQTKPVSTNKPNTTNTTNPVNTEPKPNTNALFGGMTGNGNGNGEGDGDGDKSGTGLGNKPGNGNNGAGNSGTGLNLRGRKLLNKPIPNNPTNERGKVVLNIWVNPDGWVTRANVNTALSTTTNPTLVALCIEEIKKKQLCYADESFSDEVKGTYTFNFDFN